jgi:hypothetical protein
MADKRCDTCRHYQARGKTARYTPDGRHEMAAPHGECRLGPPQPSDRLDGVVGSSPARFPLVWADDWCSVHSRVGEPTVQEKIEAMFESDDGGGVALPPDCGCARDDKPDPDAAADEPVILRIPGSRHKPPGGGVA